MGAVSLLEHRLEEAGLALNRQKTLRERTGSAADARVMRRRVWRGRFAEGVVRPLLAESLRWPGFRRLALPALKALACRTREARRCER